MTKGGLSPRQNRVEKDLGQHFGTMTGLSGIWFDLESWIQNQGAAEVREDRLWAGKGHSVRQVSCTFKAGIIKSSLRAKTQKVLEGHRAQSDTSSSLRTHRWGPGLWARRLLLFCLGVFCLPPLRKLGE